MYRTDITIIGAGIIGLSIAAELGGKGKEVYVLEKNETFGLETSSRNSEVIHSGIYYPEGSLKAKMCVEGNALLYQICERYGIGYKRRGKIIIAVDEKEAEILPSLLERGRNNGVKGLQLLSQEDIKKLEPNIRGVAGILSPFTGVIDSHNLMRFFYTKAREEGVKIAFKAKVVGIERVKEGYKVSVEEEGGLFSFITSVLINCAGLNSDKIAQLAGIDIVKFGYKLFYCKGEYFTVSSGKGKLVERLIFPVPIGTLPGIHLTLDIHGRMRLGPNFYQVKEIDYKVNRTYQREFYEGVKRFLPFIEYEDLEPEMAGIRPRLTPHREEFRDFIIKHEEDKGLFGFINLIGIESPGLTCAPAIAKYVKGIVAEIFG